MSGESDVVESHPFAWTQFYEAFANGLLAFRNNRQDLVEEIYTIAAQNPELPMIRLKDKLGDGSESQFTDMCPFTTMGIFNRNTSNDNRRALANILADFLGMKVQVPDDLDGIPVLHLMTSHFFSFARDREPDAFDALWDVFENALRFAESKNGSGVRSAFVRAYDRAAQLKQVSWNLTMGLYWARPRSFQTLDSRSREYAGKLGVSVETACKDSGEKYLTLLDELERHFQEEHFPVHSFQELSLAAWLEDSDEISVDNTNQGNKEDSWTDEQLNGATEEKLDVRSPYNVDGILNEGCFLKREEIEEALQRFREKKNLILQGPPGTGKTWLARRLAYALIGEKNDTNVHAMQFHPNLSYEDFVRGWRPSKHGKLELVDGPFIEMIDKAKADPKSNYVVVVEEINRGNPAQIFGEMLTLLEVDKREPSEALSLTYRKDPEECVYVPENLYLIGTMNLADRPLALVDFALRRRFAFVTLKPILGDSWSRWVNENCGIESNVLSTIGERINALNATL